MAAHKTAPQCRVLAAVDLLKMLLQLIVCVMPDAGACLVQTPPLKVHLHMSGQAPLIQENLQAFRELAGEQVALRSKVALLQLLDDVDVLEIKPLVGVILVDVRRMLGETGDTPRAMRTYEHDAVAVCRQHVLH